MPHRDAAIEHATATTGDELAAAQRDHLFEHRGGQWRANAWMEYRQTLTLELHLIDRVRSHLAPQMLDNAHLVLLAELDDDLVEETQHRMLRHVARLDEPRRLQYTLRRSIEFEDGIV